MAKSATGLNETMIRRHCRVLRLPTVGTNCQSWAEQAIKVGQSGLTKSQT